MRYLFKFLPNSLKSLIIDFWFKLNNPKLIPAKDDYKYTDEHLKFVHILECVNYLRVAGFNNEIPPVYFEFGCHSGRTFSAAVNAANYLGLEEAKFFAFDSFEGLPKTEVETDGIFQEGEFSTSVLEFKRIVKNRTGLQLDGENIIKGYYSDTLTDALQLKLPKAGIVHIDVDLYSSTVEVLEFIKPLLAEGSIIIFDDWYCFNPAKKQGEALAFEQFCNTNSEFSFEEWKSYSTFGKSFFVTKTP